MSEIKFSSDLFLGSQELNRIQRFLDKDGFRKFLQEHTDTWGLIRKENEAFVNGLVQEDTGLTIKINALEAFNSDGKLITQIAQSQIAIPNDGNWYWVKVAYQTTTKEKGTFAIDTSGNLTCTSLDAELKKILRGQPNYPVRVTFLNSTLNTLEYDAEEVVSDNFAVLTGQFAAESGLQLAVIGCFTPGYMPLTDEKFVYQYDSCLLSLVLSNTNTAPTHTTGKEFFLARVKSSGGLLTIEDKRNEIWTVDSNYFLHNITRLVNPLIGIEQITYDDPLSTKVENKAQIAWNFRTTAYTVNAKLNKITISAGLGGRFKAANFASVFTNGDFNNWRLYVKSGKYYKIITSTLVSSNIELVIEQFDNIDFFSDIASTIAIAQSLLVTPDADEIEIICTPDPAELNGIVQRNFLFPINLPYEKLTLSVYKDTGTYNIRYKYKHIKDYSAVLTLLTDAVGYYAEDQFNSKGVLTGSTQTPYTANDTNGYIPLKLFAGAYSNFNLGDLKGVDVKQLAAGTQVIHLVVGTDKEYQYFDQASFNLTQDLYINLKQTLSDNSTVIREGNRFQLHFLNTLVCGAFKVRLVEDFITTSSYTLLYEMNQDDFDYINSSKRVALNPFQGKLINCIWRPSQKWLVNDLNEPRTLYRDYVADDTVLTLNNSMTAISLMTLTTPNDGVTRKLKIEFKSHIYIDPADVQDNIQGDYQIYNSTTTTVLDQNTFQLAIVGGGTWYGSSAGCLLYYGSVAPNTTIVIRGQSVQHTVKMKYKKFFITEIK